MRSFMRVLPNFCFLLGMQRAAEQSARAAVEANEDESGAHTILGFVHLAQIDTGAAQTAFHAAIEHDSFNPLPRLGLGLATIRDGQLVQGRQQLEIAVALDPGSSLLRSYAGKAYYEENTRQRDELASAQFALAKQLDTQDPTSWYYEAILKESQNRPAEALQELQVSIEKNGNRAVYRSKLLLDDDAAAPTASVAAVYDNLGFERLAIVESAKALGRECGQFFRPSATCRCLLESPEARYCACQRSPPGADSSACLRCLRGSESEH